MALTEQWILEAPDDEALYDILSGELSRLLPDSIQNDRDLYHLTLTTLPRGLRAMAGIHFFDVSMALDDLAWHFGNQNDERDRRETSNGLRELELPEIADMFDRMWTFFKPHMETLASSDYGGKDFYGWLNEVGAQALADPMDKYIWDHCEKVGGLGLLKSWVDYARKYPERCVVTEKRA